jgi:hypothetical protein
MGAHTSVCPHLPDLALAHWCYPRHSLARSPLDSWAVLQVASVTHGTHHLLTSQVHHMQFCSSM